MAADPRTAPTCPACQIAAAPGAVICPRCAQVLIPDDDQTHRDLRQQVLPTLPAEVQQRVQAIEQEIRGKPETCTLWAALANIYLEAGAKELAREYITKAARLEPANRFVQERARLLRAPEIAPPPRLPLSGEEAGRSSERSYRGVALIGGGVTGLAILAVVARAVLAPSSGVLVQAPDKQDASHARFSSDGKTLAYLQAPRATLFGAVAALEGNISGETWLVVQKLGGEPRKLVNVGQGRVEYLDFAWRPRHAEISFVGWSDDGDDGGRSVIFHLPAQGGEPRRLVDAHTFAWSPSGRWLAFINSNWRERLHDALSVLDSQSGQIRMVSRNNCSHLSWSPRDDVLIYQAQDPDRVRDLVRGRRGYDDDTAIDDRTLERAGRYVGDIYQFEPSSGREKQLTRSGHYQSPIFGPDGSQIFALVQGPEPDGQQQLVSLDAGGDNETVVLKPEGEIRGFGDFAVSPRDGSIVFEGVFKTDLGDKMKADKRYGQFFQDAEIDATDLYVVQPDGSGLQRLKTKHTQKSAPSFSPDGETLIYEVSFLDAHREIWTHRP
ncbi:MAG: hypothetical protein ABIJ09_16600 [Pseudomonadota bacterium]